MGKQALGGMVGDSAGKGASVSVLATPSFLANLQVCVSSVELLEGMPLPAEAHQAVARLSAAVDALIAAAAAARRPADAIESRLSAGSRGERS
jgi:hypothetical protein